MDTNSPNLIINSEAYDLLLTLDNETVDLIYIDPPFNTKKKRSLVSLTTKQNEDGPRQGFGGKKYDEQKVSHYSYEDNFDDYQAFLKPLLQQSHRILKNTGSIYVHVDYREAVNTRNMLDSVFGSENFLNEIIWAYDFGGRGKNCWPKKHDNIYFYAKNAGKHVFNWDEVERIPYMAPGLVSKEKAERGKMPTDTWWHSIVGTNSKEKTGYPTQKPIGILKRIISASSPKGGRVLDFFAGSGTTGAAALELGRRFTLCDSNPEAYEVMLTRFKDKPDVCVGTLFELE